jgi:formiminotetrahydrofolate cyclodeaminase
MGDYGSAQRPLAELLDSVAAHTAAPGGGSAAAWTAALGAALVEMAALYAGADGPAGQAATLRAALPAIGETELRWCEPVLEASRLPRNDPARAERLGAALAAASESPLAIARAAAEVADLGAAVASRISQRWPGMQ